MQMMPQHFSITILLLSIFDFSGCASLVAVSSKELNISSREEIKLGDKFSFHSHTLNEARSYLIHLPKSYNDDSIYPKKYPVLYILDGESHFNYASGMVDFMSSAGVTNNYQIPELIVVAIPNKEPGKDNRFRDYSPTLVRDYYNESGGGDLFLKFLRDELIPHIESEYRTIPLRVLAGHSMGGLLTIYDFLNEPSIFNAHIGMDPSIWWDNKLLFKRAREIDLSNLAGSLYLSTYGSAQRREEYREFIGIIDTKKSAKLRTRFQVFESERHGSLPIVSLYNGLLFIFEGYRPVELNSFVENPSLIGKHFSKFSQMLGVDFLPPEDLIHLICSETIKANPDKTIDCFKVNVSNYPTSYNAHNALAMAYASKGMKQEAIRSYQTSLKLKPGNTEGLKGLRELGGD